MSPMMLDRLPCPHLRELHLDGFHVQLMPAEDGWPNWPVQGVLPWPGVLPGCTGLTALDLRDCELSPRRSSFAAIAAIQDLQRLQVMLPYEYHPDTFYVFPVFQHPLKLTYLSISYDDSLARDIEQLTHLAALVNLQHLHLAEVPSTGYPGGWPSQLVKLTCLRIEYSSSSSLRIIQQQFQHLS
jgi:hypothetical protein